MQPQIKDGIRHRMAIRSLDAGSLTTTSSFYRRLYHIFLHLFVLALLIRQLRSQWKGMTSGPKRRTACVSPSIRVEWSTLTEEEKEAYFAANLCLLNAPAQTSISGVLSRYDDLVSIHAQQSNFEGGTDLWHVTGQFLAVHRYYLHAFETLVRNECGYVGRMPYWNEPPDAGAFNESALVSEFGGEGFKENNYAVVNGPFANITLHLGPGMANTPHLLTRECNWWNSTRVGQAFVDAVNARTTFAGFQNLLFATIHRGGHNAVGGDMTDIQTAPNDPLFWLHHSYIDYLWWKWQGDNETRIFDREGAGYETQAEPKTGFVETSEATVLHMFDVLPNGTVGQVLDTQGDYLCYTYI
ncbi:hypothetical protein EV421DRAFT_1475578 [Armillaria borealis]|uniref:Tyrosinase copper-binding domain-containing protein n=1 Tax=Armillaria borealis TaxID=47425 RepID=A0AA39MWI5_9AGAR|nr:hypothetical protein EV421DRAFT_1475578 [Armillaria borealis]